MAVSWLRLRERIPSISNWYRSTPGHGGIDAEIRLIAFDGVVRV
jgi:hypothetical protein